MIKEGLGNYSDALFYLNTLYNLTPSEEVLYKIEALAKKNNLTGYESSDLDLLFILKYRYYQESVFILLGLLISTLIIIFIQFKKKETPSTVFIAISAILITSTIYFTNFKLLPDKAIVTNQEASLRTHPTNAASTITNIPNGTRIEIKDDFDIWTKTTHDENEGYVKSIKIRNLIN